MYAWKCGVLVLGHISFPIITNVATPFSTNYAISMYSLSV